MNSEKHMQANDDAARLVELVLRARDDRRSRDWVLMNLSLSEAIEHAEAMEIRARATGTTA